MPGAVSASSRWGRICLFAAVFLAILGAKFLLIDRYGSDLPYWDQWDGEGEHLIRPYLEGRLTAHEFFRAHNEHRPVLTRIWSLALLEVSGRQWDARVQLLANTFLHAALALLLLRLAWRALPPIGVVIFGGMVVLFFSTSVSWENTLAGFQSQFYFVLLFSALHLGGTFLAPARSWRWWLAPLAGVAALFSMASGLLSALAITAAAAGRSLRDRRVTRDDLYVLGVNIPLVVAGLLLKADVPGHAALNAATLGTWADAFFHQFSWPVVSLWAAPLGLIPPALVAIAYFRRRIDGPVALTLLAASTWFCLQAAAIAYARGAESHGYASRYCDTLSVGVLVNCLVLAYLGATAGSRRFTRIWLSGSALYATVALWGLSGEGAAARENTLQHLPAINAARIATVRNYVVAKDPSFFGRVPWDELPYPDARLLAGYLDTPALRESLPPSVRSPIEMTADATASRNFSDFIEVGKAGHLPSGLAAWKSVPDAEAEFTSTPFAAQHGRVYVFLAGDGGGETRIQLIDSAGKTHPPLGPITPGPRWKRINFAVSPGTYRLLVHHRGSGWCAFTQPTTTTALSALGSKLTRWGPGLIATSIGVAVAALMLLFSGFFAIRGTSKDRAMAAIPLLLALALTCVLLANLGVISPTSGGVSQHFAGHPVDNFGLSEPSSGGEDSKFDGAVFRLPGNTARWFGTYVNGDGYTGSLVGTDFVVSSPLLHVPILGYPNSNGNRLALEILDGDRNVAVVVPYHGENPRERQGSWELPVAEWAGRKARLRLTDGETVPGGWLAVGPPELGQMSGPSSYVDAARNYGWFGISVLACVALLFVPGLALRTWWPRMPSATALVPLPGLAILVLGGVGIWLGGTPGAKLPIAISLAVQILIAAALAVAWSRGSSPIDRGERVALMIYCCVVLGALAYGVLPLPVAQEYDSGSTGQGRMIASPPDHLIPYRSGVYFFHQKDGREDRITYFGTDWSIASRGPIVPLALASLFAAWNERPSDPPGSAHELWPASRDGTYLARIFGVLTNALIILGGAALAARIAPLTARTSIIWLAVCPVIAINTDFLWPKLLATYFVLLAVRSACIEPSSAKIGVWTALGYLSHPVGGLMAPAVWLFAMDQWRVKNPGGTRSEYRRKIAGSILRIGATFLVCVAPWLVYKLWINVPDPFPHYPLGDGRGFEHAASVSSWLRCRWDNLWLTLIPGAFYFSHQMQAWIEGPLNAPLRWAIGYAKTLPGAVGFVAYGVALFAASRRPSVASAGFRRHLLLGAFALMLLFWGYSNDGLGRNCLEPLAVLFLVYTVSELPATWPGWRWVLLVTAIESLSARAIGVFAAPGFSVSAIDAEILLVAATIAAATLAPALWFFFRRADDSPARVLAAPGVTGSSVLPPFAPSRPSRPPARHAAVTAVAGLLLILFARRPEMFFRPQFWAEDGAIFFLQQDSFGARALMEPSAGYHHLLLRLIAAMSAPLNAAWIPTFYFTASLLVLLAVAAALFSPRIDLRHRVACALALGLVPQMGEAIGNLTNLQWVSALALVWLLLATDPARPRQWATDCLVALVVGLTGTFSILFAPLFVWRACRRKSTASLVLAMLIVATGLIQMGTVVYTSAAAMDSHATLGEIMWFVGFRLPTALFLPVATAEVLPRAVALILGAATVVLLSMAAWRGGPRRETRQLLVACIILVIAATIFRARSDLMAFATLQNGDRYFFIPKVLTVWLVLGTGSERGWIRWIGWGACVLALGATIANWRYERWPDRNWPLYARQIEAGERVRGIVVNPGMTFDHPGRHRK